MEEQVTPTPAGKEPGKDKQEPARNGYAPYASGAAPQPPRPQQYARPAAPPMPKPAAAQQPMQQVTMQQPAQPQAAPPPGYPPTYYQQVPYYAPPKPRESNPLTALSMGIVATVLYFCATLGTTLLIDTMNKDVFMFTLVFNLLLAAAQLTFGIVAMVMGYRCIKERPCGRATTSYIFGLVNTIVGSCMVIYSLIRLIVSV